VVAARRSITYRRKRSLKKTRLFNENKRIIPIEMTCFVCGNSTFARGTSGKTLAEASVLVIILGEKLGYKTISMILRGH